MTTTGKNRIMIYGPKNDGTLSSSEWPMAKHSRFRSLAAKHG
jgi:hypothetical protein